MKRFLKTVACLAALLALHVSLRVWLQMRHTPPDSVKEVHSLLEWMGKPWWVNRYSDGTAVYHELGMRVPVWILTVSLASGSPSYTVDGEGKFIGWSPDSGDIHRPEVIHRLRKSRTPVDVEEFLRQHARSPR